MITKEFLCEIQISLSSLCFGLSFVGQRYAAEYDTADPMTYNSWRFIISFFSVYLLRNRLQSLLKTNISSSSQDTDTAQDTTQKQQQIETETETETEDSNIPIFHFLSQIAIKLSMKEETLHVLFWGILGGIINFIIQTSQQYGLQTVSAGKAALINGLFVVVTPFLESILPYFESHINFTSWCAILLSGVGTYFLSSPDSESSFGFGYGECLLVVSMLGCCCVILISDVASKRADCIDLTIIELGTVLLLSTCFSLWNHIEYWYWPLPALQSGILMVLFVGLSEATGFVLSTLGQMHISSHRASVIYGLEGVFASFFGYLFVGEILTGKELFGCLLIFIGTVLGGAPVSDEESDQTETGEIDSIGERQIEIDHEKQQLVEKSQKSYGSTL